MLQLEAYWVGLHRLRRREHYATRSQRIRSRSSTILPSSRKAGTRKPTKTPNRPVTNSALPVTRTLPHPARCSRLLAAGNHDAAQGSQRRANTYVK